MHSNENRNIAAMKVSQSFFWLVISNRNYVAFSFDSLKVRHQYHTIQQSFDSQRDILCSTSYEDSNSKEILEEKERLYETSMQHLKDKAEIHRQENARARMEIRKQLKMMEKMYAQPAEYAIDDTGEWVRCDSNCSVEHSTVSCFNHHCSPGKKIWWCVRWILSNLFITHLKLYKLDAMRICHRNFCLFERSFNFCSKNCSVSFNIVNFRHNQQFNFILYI